MKLNNRVAIVTGASRGVGRVVALALAKEGCDVVLASKTVEPHPKLPGTILTVAKEVEELGRKALPVQTDVRFVDQVHAMVDKTVEAFGKVDILINNAGAAWWYGIEETPEKRYDLVMDVNCKGPFFAAQACVKHMREARWGHIVNMSPPIKATMAGNKIAYMISKFGMTLLTHGLAIETKDDNIAVNSLWPVTLIESLATKNLGLGEPKDWRKADILADATVAIVSQDPSKQSGEALLDEHVLRAAGVEDFEPYACVPGSKPLEIPW